MALNTFSRDQLEGFGRLLADEMSHTQLTVMLRQCSIPGTDEGPRWARILHALDRKQVQDRCGNNVAAFIQAVMAPVRYVGRGAHYDELRVGLNRLLAFSGLSLGEDGKLSTTVPAQTISEAEERAGRLRAELVRRNVHSDVIRFCRAEWMQENYFHAVLEATKSVADKIRSRTGLKCDGAELVDAAFGMKAPLLAINRLQTETELAEQKGFGNLIKGMLGVFRHVTAHDPKIHRSVGERDALDLLTMLSYIHRRLDEAVTVPKAP